MAIFFNFFTLYILFVYDSIHFYILIFLNIPTSRFWKNVLKIFTQGCILFVMSRIGRYTPVKEFK